ncbi:LOW QUALITY PROTEIN: zinc finger MYM-type protein 1-like [Trachinotus anak]|uniref:LOW QUALITY PROTEIN: zinc finger MYM-type protein 1-like n=1 Tax=Trachinotus anak TaxID=443729 RepID=UPI0039F2221D
MELRAENENDQPPELNITSRQRCEEKQEETDVSEEISSEATKKTSIWKTTCHFLGLRKPRKWNDDSISIHNAEVKENREVLRDLINVTCFLAKQQLAFSGHDESTGSANCGNYVELLHAFAEKDDRLAGHLETSTVFSGLSNRIQNDFIEAVANVIRHDIKKEISATPFVAVEVDETTDHKPTDCEVKEAFLGFDDMSEDRHAPAIGEYVLGVLEKYDSVDKLVAQTYDGAATMASELNGVQAKIKEKVPEATFTHCYAHRLNLVLLHSAKCLPKCRAFFKTAEGLASFFSSLIILVSWLSLVWWIAQNSVKCHNILMTRRACQNMNKFFDFVRLKADPVGLYSSQMVRDECKSPGQLLSFLAQMDLIQTVPEATKLLQLVLTVPATTASVERSFSALKRLKTYSRKRTD